MDKPSTNRGVIFVVVLTLAFNATMGMCVLGYCLIFKVEPNVALLTTFVGIVNFLFGAVSGMLVKTSPTETTKAAPVVAPPIETVITNKPDNPVPTTEEAKP